MLLYSQGVFCLIGMIIKQGVDIFLNHRYYTIPEYVYWSLSLDLHHVRPIGQNSSSRSTHTHTHTHTHSPFPQQCDPWS